MIPKETTRGLVPGIARYLSDAEFKSIAPRLDRRSLKAGEVLMRFGEENSALFYLERGELGISLPFPDRTVSLGSRHAGSWVGELTWLEPGPVSATVVATRDSSLLSIERDVLFSLGREQPDVAARLLRAVSEDLARRVRNAGVVLDAPLAADSERTGLWAQLRGLFGGDAS